MPPSNVYGQYFRWRYNFIHEALLKWSEYRRIYIQESQYLAPRFFRYIFVVFVIVFITFWKCWGAKSSKYWYLIVTFQSLEKSGVVHFKVWKGLFNPLTPNDVYSGHTVPLTSKRCILYIYSTYIGTEYFKHGVYYLFFPLQNAVCFINLTCLVPVLFTFYIEGVLKLKK